MIANIVALLWIPKSIVMLMTLEIIPLGVTLVPIWCDKASLRQNNTTDMLLYIIQMNYVCKINKSTPELPWGFVISRQLNQMRSSGPKGRPEPQITR